jgi:arylsulfatase
MEAQALTAQFIGTFKEYPPRQKAASFTVDQILQNMQSQRD